METNLQKKRHRTAETSKQSFLEFNRTKQRSKETVLVFDALKKFQPVTSRSLVNLTGLERTNLTRTLFEIVNAPDPLAKIIYDRPCPVTGRKVHWYSLIEFEAKEGA